MATLKINGLDELANDFASLAALPESVTDDMLNAAADVVVRAQQTNTAKTWHGPYATGTTSRSIKKDSIKKSGMGKSITISPKGKNRRKAENAVVAFVNERGVHKRQPARPAIDPANHQAEGKAVDTAEKVYHKYLDSKNL